MNTQTLSDLFKSISNNTIINPQIHYHKIQIKLTINTQRKSKKFYADSKVLEKDEVIKTYFEKWNKNAPPSSPPKWPLNINVWKAALAFNQSSDKTDFVQQLEHGVTLSSKNNIHCDQGQESYKLSIKDWRFVCQQVDEYTDSKKNCVWGAFKKEDIKNNPRFANSNIMPHFVDHKLKENGKIKQRLVTDASHSAEAGLSFNDNINDEDKEVEYHRIRDIVQMIVTHNLIWLVSADAMNAFNRVPINNKYIHYFGILIGQFLFYWTCLTFGGASSCNIYTWFASYIISILVYHHKTLFVKNGVIIIRQYLDDFITESSSYTTAWLQYFVILIWFQVLGIPTQPTKMTEPHRILKHIGYILDTLRKILQIPKIRLLKTRILGLELIDHIDNKDKLIVRKIMSFVGTARCLSPVYYYIVPFVRGLEELYHYKEPTDRVHGNIEVKKDIELIINALSDPRRNSISFKWFLYDKSCGDIIVETDASGTIGLGGYEMKNGGISFKVRFTEIVGWDNNNKPDILYLEMLAIWVAQKLQSTQWTKKAISFNCDNKAVVAMLIKKKACFERKDCQDLIRDICLESMNMDYYHWYQWKAGIDNIYADGLSRFKWDIINKPEFDLINKDKEALYWAQRGLNRYKKARKRMVRNLGDDKICCCKDKQVCEDQPLYPKWISSSHSS